MHTGENYGYAKNGNNFFVPLLEKVYWYVCTYVRVFYIKVICTYYIYIPLPETCSSLLCMYVCVPLIRFVVLVRETML